MTFSTAKPAPSLPPGGDEPNERPGVVRGAALRLARRVLSAWGRLLGRADAAVADWPLRHKIAVPLVVALLLSVGAGAIASYQLELEAHRRSLAREAGALAESLVIAGEALPHDGDLGRVLSRIGADSQNFAVVATATPRQIVASTRPALVGASLGRIAEPILLRTLAQSLNSRAPAFAFDGAHATMVYAAPLQLADRRANGGGTPGVVGVVVDARPVYGEALREALMTVLGIFLVASVVLGLTFVALRRAVLHPLSAAQRAVLAIKNGATSVRAPVFGTDEIGQLASALNDAFDAVAEKEARLADKLAELELARERLQEQRCKLGALAEDLDIARLKAEDGNRAKSEFLAMVSHEIRTPMNGVLGTLRLLLDGTLAGDERRLAGLAHESAASLLTLIDDILDFSKLEVGRVALEEIDFNLGRMVDSVVALLNVRAADKGIVLRALLDPGIPPVLRGDPARLRQILFNLVGNAIKFTERGSVTVSGGHRRLGDGWIALRIEVADTGIGIAPEALPGLFTRYAQADSSIARRYGGTGLGLAICKQLVELMGGAIEIASTPGLGSRFSFTVRCRVGQATAIGGGHAAAYVAPARRLRVLVAEDNAVNQLVTQAMLERFGHDAVIVSNGQEALAAAAGSGFHVVLMDLHMPVMDGLAATRAIRALDGPAAGVPIIALTADAMDGGRDHCLAMGIDDYVTKPVEPRELAAALARCVVRELAPETAAEAAETGADARPVGPTPDAIAAMQTFIASLDGLRP
jgi:signal transduction histidine kinase/DNA-binding NarL/FixJ family response regulator